jgi:hypothetical protein
VHPRITLAAPDARIPRRSRGVRGIPITRGFGGVGLGACVPAPAHRLQSEDLQTCRPFMETYNVPCDANTINCVLFRKESFEANKGRIRAHLATKSRQTSAEAQYTWMNELCTLIDKTIHDTNIRPVWLFGGPVSVDYNRNTILPYLPAGLWDRTRAFLSGLSREAAADDSCLPIVAFPCGLPIYHNPRAFTANVSGCRRGTAGEGGSGGSASALGTRGLGAVPPRYYWAPVPQPVDPAVLIFPVGGRQNVYSTRTSTRCPLTSAMPPGLRRSLLARFPGMRVDDERVIGVDWREFSVLYLRAMVGSGLGTGTFPFKARAGGDTRDYWRNLGARINLDRDGLEYVTVAMPKALTWMAYYEALANDILAVPFEAYVLFGLEQWAGNMQVWAARLGLNPEDFRGLVIRAHEAQSRAMVGAGFAITAQLFSAANPIAGMVVQALGLVVDLVQALGGVAVGGWQCPTPLTIRSASGDCDFSQLLGPEAAERMGRQQSGVQLYFGQDNEGADEASTAISSIPKPVLIGGALLVAGAAAYFLLR